MSKGAEYSERKASLYSLKLEKERTDPQLTFRPALPFYECKNRPTDKPIWERMFETQQKYWSGKFDRLADAVEWTKEPYEYTFKPDISLSNSRTSGTKQHSSFKKEGSSGQLKVAPKAGSAPKETAAEGKDCETTAENLVFENVLDDRLKDGLREQ
jgi:hypothetical protein